LDVYFFDSSALLKLYLAETGTAWLGGIADPDAGNLIFIATIAGVEVVSAIARRQRAGAIGADQAAKAIADFRQDFVHEYFIIELDDKVVSEAMSLAERRSLRAYDAVQLAAVLEVYRRRTAQKLSPPELISADTALNDAALLEGLKVDDRSQQPLNV
jgi:uncharacterized protein